MSKGHSAGALYTCLWSIGLLSDDDLRTFHQDGTLLAGHPPTHGIPSVSFATGSLGHGLSLAAGTALGFALRKQDRRVYCVTSDGEWQEGSTWEALIFATHHRLRNLTVLIDHNRLQGFGSTEDVASMLPLAPKLGGYDVALVSVDGHDIEAIRSAVSIRLDVPTVIVLETIKGHGVSFLENRMDSHYLPLSKRAVRTGTPGDRSRMRTQFCDAMIAEADRSDELLFLTGDLGFMALEPIQQKLGPRFINCGVAEQNMVTVAAALAAQNFAIWVYSIAPFCYARPFEQVRNDVAFHNLPVHLVGNGGGYGYGVMGPTHHAIEDYGVLLTLPNMHVYVPAFDEDLPQVVANIGKAKSPTYLLRLGRGEPPMRLRCAGVCAVAAIDGR